MAVRSLNKVMLIGNLTRDPNLRYTPGNTAVCSFGVATNRSWSTEDGDFEERTDFHNLVAWAKLAEICDQILRKGDKVYVEGRLQTRDWKTNDGDDRRVTEIVLDSMIKLGSPQGKDYNRPKEDVEDQGPEDEEKGETKKAAKDEAEEEVKKGEDVDVEEVADDIPF
jgi:single-strand DNA-binding protein